MAVLDQIRQMKKEGLDEQQIISNLQEQGTKPKEIIDAIQQSRIKDAIEDTQMNPENQNYAPMPEEQYQQDENYPQDTNMQPQDQYYQNYQPPQQQEQYYPQENYDQNADSVGISTDTIIEVAEQVFEEKIKKIKNLTDEFKEFSTISGTKLASMEDRLKRIETIIDNLQIKILEKIGSYGQNLDSIKKEMSMMEDSFSKMVPEIAKRNSSKIINNSNQEQSEENNEQESTQQNYSQPIQQRQYSQPERITKKIIPKKK